MALVSDERGVRFPGLFEDVQTHVIPAGRFAGGPIGWVKAAKAMLDGRAMALELYKTFQPAAVIGFGGYPAFPALAAALRAEIPTAVHEQNAVLGRVNRLVAGQVEAIATSYPDTQRLNDKYAAKTKLIGNPVREAVLALRHEPYPELEADGIFRVLVTGGSQGATVLSQVVPDGLSLLPLALRQRMQVDASGADRGHRRRAAQKYAEHAIPADAGDLYRRHAGRAGVGASGDRAGGGVDHRGTDRRGAARDPGAAAERDRRSPDRERARDHRGGRRADDRAAAVHRDRTGQADPEARARSQGAGECGGARAGLRAARCGQGPGRPGRGLQP